MSHSTNNSIQISNPFQNKYQEKIDIILFAHQLIGTVRGKSANGLIIHSQIFNVVAIVDKLTVGGNTSELCQGVHYNVPIYESLSDALRKHKAKALVFLIPPATQWHSEIEIAMRSGLDIINTSFHFLSLSEELRQQAKKYKVSMFDLRDVAHLKAYPNINILNRKTKVIYITGTDCGLGKRTATFEITQEAKKRGYKATMFATGQTGLMLGEQGTVVDSLIVEFSNGIISQHICQLDAIGYDLVFVEGQSDIFHPANSAVAISILHGANPDCMIVVHDEDRKVHRGFEEDSDLYRMHPLNHYIKTLEMLSLPCGPSYKTAGIATIGINNINIIQKMDGMHDIAVADVLMQGGPGKLLDAVLNYTKLLKS